MTKTPALKSKQEGREDWRVKPWHVKDGRVFGTLLVGSRVVRSHFEVAVQDDRTFQVDIGTGSGVKIKFELPARS